MQLKQLCDFCDDYLKIGDFNDYCPNGLQVEANPQVQRIICGVTASQALIEAAADDGADTIIVHHGYFWKGEAQPITGVKGRRIGSLIRNNINLIAYHLPLDAHPEVGNNVQLARVLGWQTEGSFGEQNLVFEGRLSKPLSLPELALDIETRLDTRALAIAAGEHEVSRLAWCTGAAQGFIEAAAARGVDAFVSGEVSEPTFHLAREMGIHYIAAGHHATERYGIQALGAAIVDRFGIELQFIDIPNPV
ncbi:MAG: Nif3-like dinuclear metal center hexameric protein [Gammaproteobacteria bacterium]|nr:Nif3-like dinuclear metal center hexameric protein [Gammaproteobacteria bacterium]MDH3537558.1 Nif3-like dinuclear metal center hexameric protein [Gammaproteobacteria bacterium]